MGQIGIVSSAIYRVSSVLPSLPRTSSLVVSSPSVALHSTAEYRTGSNVWIQPHLHPSSAISFKMMHDRPHTSKLSTLRTQWRTAEDLATAYGYLFKRGLRRSSISSRCERISYSILLGTLFLSQVQADVDFRQGVVSLGSTAD